MTDQPELKPCPFCGSDNIVFEVWQPGVVNVYQIHCLGCNFKSEYIGFKYGEGANSDENQDAAIAAWNTRVLCEFFKPDPSRYATCENMDWHHNGSYRCQYEGEKRCEYHQKKMVPLIYHPEIKPCPICKRHPDIEHISPDDHLGNTECWIIECRWPRPAEDMPKGSYWVKHCCTVIENTNEQAITAWNNRDEPFGNPEELQSIINMRVEELEEQIECNNTYRARDLVLHEITTLKWVLSLKKPEED